MLFRRRPRIPKPHAALISDLLAEQERAGNYWYNFDPSKSVEGQRILSLTPDEQRAFVLAAATWIATTRRDDLHSRYVVYRMMVAVLRHRLPFEHDDVAALLDWSIREPYDYLRAVPQMIKVLEGYLRKHELTPELRERIGELVGRLLSGYTPADVRR